MRKFIFLTLFLAMYTLCHEIVIGQHRLASVESVEIESSQSFLADRCSIKVPSQVRGRAYNLEGKLKRGDKVTVKLGYSNDLRTEFQGYVKHLQPNSPFEIECEDALYLFRKPIANKILKATTAPAIAQYVVDEINKQVATTDKIKLVTDFKGFEFTKFAIHEANGFEVLDKLRQETGLAVFVRGSDLHLHLLYKYKPSIDLSGNKVSGDVKYDFTRNVRDTTHLEYQNANDAQIFVKVIGRDAKGKKIEGVAGEKGGDVRTIQRPTVSTPKSLQDIAEQTRKGLIYTGYKGSINGWLLPYCEVGYTAKIIDPDYSEREGKYYVSAVRTTFNGSQGGVRNVQLGIKI